MKKYTVFILLFILLTACKYTDDVTFDQKASDRTVATLNTYKKAFEETDTYWVLTIYPEVYRAGYWVYPFYPEIYKTDREFPRAHRSVGGYNFVVKLKDGKVTASSEVNGNNDEVDSFFTYSVTEGPTISFDTYNSVLHHFRFVSGLFPNARGGETEYIIVNEENGVYTLRGRTTNNTATLTRLQGDRETYLNKLAENTETLAGKGLSSISVNGTNVDLYLFPSYHQLTFIYGDHQHQQQAFVMTERGIKFYEPVTINGVTFSEFYINEAKTALVTPDDTFTTEFVASPITITDEAKTITFDSGYVCDGLLNLYNRVATAIANNYSFYDLNRDKDLTIQALKGNDQRSATVFNKFVPYSAGYNGGAYTYYEVEFVGVPNQPNQVQIYLKDRLAHPDYLEGYYRNQIQFFDEVTALYRYIAQNGPYIVAEAGNYYSFSSTKNSDIWFYMSK
ncbi:hypothetical protein RCZ04_13370 [Capnocytophaga sp. HP1101]